MIKIIAAKTLFIDRDLTLRYAERTASFLSETVADGYFSGIDSLKRIRLAENTYDLGQYLLDRHRSGELDTHQLSHPNPGSTL